MKSEDVKWHWDKIYESKEESQFNWFQQYPETSVEFLNLFRLPKTANIIDVGGGDSHFVDVLIELEYQNIYVLDVSAIAIKRVKKRLGKKAEKVNWIVEVSLSHYHLKGEEFVITFVIDITIRKKNEILFLQQQHELQQITTEVQNLNRELEQKVQERTMMLKETLAELEKSKEELKEALTKEKDLGELKSRFVTMASHEFRTPLSTIN